MGPPPRSLTAEANSCFMVRGPAWTQPNTRLRREHRARAWAPLGSTIPNLEQRKTFNRVVLTVRRSLPVFPHKQTISGSVGMSQTCHTHGSRGRGLLDQIAGAGETGRRVTLEVLLCGGRRYTTEPAIHRRAPPIQKCENRVRVRADGPLPPLPLLRFLDEPGPTQGSDKSKDYAGSGGRPSWPPRLPHRNDQAR